MRGLIGSKKLTTSFFHYHHFPEETYLAPLMQPSQTITIAPFLKSRKQRNKETHSLVGNIICSEKGCQVTVERGKKRCPLHLQLNSIKQRIMLARKAKDESRVTQLEKERADIRLELEKLRKVRNKNQEPEKETKELHESSIEKKHSEDKYVLKKNQGKET
jgi:hypothetical protein